MNYLAFLDQLHRVLHPAVYLEIGVFRGQSLALSHTRTIAIDPAPTPRPEALAGKPWLKLYQQASDDFFRTHQKDAVLEGQPLDLVFVDGLHEFAQIVRDLENVERWSHPETIVVVHDVLPRGAWQASRAAREYDWTGDVWRLVPFLAAYRPDLSCRLVAVEPTGVLVVTGLGSGDHRLIELAAVLDRDFPLDGDAYSQLVEDFLAGARPESAEAFFRSLPVPPRTIGHRLAASGWHASSGDGLLRPGDTEASALTVALEERPRGAYRITLELAVQGPPVVRLQLTESDGDHEWQRNIWLDVERPGALYHEVERVGLDYAPERQAFLLEIDGLLPVGAELCALSVHPASPELHDIAPPENTAVGLHRIDIAQMSPPASIVRYVPESVGQASPLARQRHRQRDAVIFAWFVPERMPELGEYFLNLLRCYHPDSRLFVGMNRGTSPHWEGAIRASGLDAEICWARPELEDYWDTTGFMTALARYAAAEEPFRLVWFGHTKGGSQPEFAAYVQTRFELQRTFWACRPKVERLFADPKVGIFAPRFAPLPDGEWAADLAALLRIYRGPFAPLGLHAKETFYVMRDEIVREFCRAVGADVFAAAPGSFGATRYFFELGFPSIVSLQGFEPYIDLDVAGASHPRDDVWLTFDPNQNHRLAQAELERWRADPIGFSPRQIREVWDPDAP